MAIMVLVVTAVACAVCRVSRLCSWDEQARGGSGAWYAMELNELLPHVARGLNINWDEAIRYAGLTNAE
jgi:hypothetical protein